MKKTIQALLKGPQPVESPLDAVRMARAEMAQIDHEASKAYDHLAALERRRDAEAEKACAALEAAGRVAYEETMAPLPDLADRISSLQKVWAAKVRDLWDAFLGVALAQLEAKELCTKAHFLRAEYGLTGEPELPPFAKDFPNVWRDSDGTIQVNGGILEALRMTIGAMRRQGEMPMIIGGGPAR